MQAIAHAASPQAAFEATLQVLLSLDPERALVAHGVDDEGTPRVQVAHGVDAATVLMTGEISLETLRKVLHTGEPLHLIDAQQSDLADRNSVVLSGLRSVMVAPVMGTDGEAAGLLYCDNRVRPGAFDEAQLDTLVQIADALSQRLAQL